MPYPQVSTPDRTVHAEMGREQVVRYERAGKWYIEFILQQDGLGNQSLKFANKGKKVTADQAALRAVQMERDGGKLYLRMPGGNTFDRLVKKHREAMWR
jgi:hypothetical protein